MVIFLSLYWKLSLNKERPLFNQDNGVIARQLIALCEEEKLICFDVYPIDTDRVIRNMFREYDIRFAEALGTELYQRKNNNEDYTIRNILSQNWWDDFPWYLTDSYSKTGNET